VVEEAGFHTGPSEASLRHVPRPARGASRAPRRDACRGRGRSTGANDSFDP